MVGIPTCMEYTVQGSNNDNVVELIKSAQFAGPEVHNYIKILIIYICVGVVGQIHFSTKYITHILICCRCFWDFPKQGGCSKHIYKVVRVCCESDLNCEF